MNWKPVKTTYGSMEGLYLGNIRVASVSYNSGKPKGAVGVDYVGSIHLPGKDTARSYSDDKSALQAVMENRVMGWLDNANLRSKDGD